MSVTNILERYRTCQGSLELFALEGQRALDLLQSNPLAGFCLAVNWVFHKPAVPWPLSAARHYMDKPQREILAWLGFQPATESTAKLGRKCLPEALTIDRCRRHRRILTRETIRHLLTHAPRINAGVLELTGERDFHVFLTPSLLADVSARDTEETDSPVARLLADIRQMHRLVRRGEPLPRLQSVRGLEDYHDDLVAALNASGIRYVRRGIYPPPPIDGVGHAGLIITPILNRDDLLALGRVQHNCVASYLRRIMAGDSYIYRVTAKSEVATLALVKTRQGDWRVGELRGACNRSVSSTLIQGVQDWLATSQSSRAPGRAAVAQSGAGGPTVATLSPPPLAGHDQAGLTIVPLTNSTMLTACGVDLAQYLPQIQRRQACVYRVITSQRERGVIVLSRPREGAWQIKAVIGEDQTRIRGETLAAIAQWLGRVQGRYR